MRDECRNRGYRRLRYKRSLNMEYIGPIGGTLLKPSTLGYKSETIWFLHWMKTVSAMIEAGALCCPYRCWKNEQHMHKFSASLTNCWNLAHLHIHLANRLAQPRRSAALKKKPPSR